MKKLAKKIARFFVGVKAEMKKVNWTNKKEMIKYSGATLSFIIIFAAFFSLTDILLAGLKSILGGI